MQDRGLPAALAAEVHAASQADLEGLAGAWAVAAAHPGAAAAHATVALLDLGDALEGGAPCRPLLMGCAACSPRSAAAQSCPH